ncbi:glycoside hydrolase family 3 protein [Vibrio jasicida]|uniref:glycoside hydrolase family 3 protein n=1 Tax=Vibrio jasicida TaxID=766224 RepID=UPI0003A33AC6|nr:glycoside hydrolase family 3 protein [Vibrio jasicida]
MKKQTLCILSILGILSGCNNGDGNEQSLEQRAESILSEMTTREKIAQKITMSFRYFCADDVEECSTGLTQINESVRRVIKEESIGGVILFSSNMDGIKNTARLIWDMQDSVSDDQPLGLFMTIDQEGGNVVRLPREQATNFAGNMALGAAYLGDQFNDNLAYRQGLILGREVGSIGFNVNFAPVVDVQSNPLNPVINVRSFGESPEDVGVLGGQTSMGMSDAHVVSAFKHFPGHGDTEADSHYGLPRVNKTLEEAYATDLYPYISTIQAGTQPDMIMTAHIQYPALDDSVLYTSKETDDTPIGSEILVPATLSYHIQTELLRNELGYSGLTISDALDMKGIADYFTEEDAVVKLFNAGVDIALMPTEFYSQKDDNKVTHIIDAVMEAVDKQELSIELIDDSVKRIILTKLENNILNENGATDFEDVYSYSLEVLQSSEHKEVEKEIADKSITIVKNNGLLPANASTLGKIHIITPWEEQGATIQIQLERNNVSPFDISRTKFSNTSWDEAIVDIDNADTLVIGTNSTAPSPVEDDGIPNATKMVAFSKGTKAPKNLSNYSLVRASTLPTDESMTEEQLARYLFEYASQKEKQSVHLSLRAPYDIVNYDDIVDTSIAAYNYYGYENGSMRGPSLPAVIDTLMGVNKPKGRLPVNVYEIELDEDGNTVLGEVKYPIGHGLSY